MNSFIRLRHNAILLFLVCISFRPQDEKFAYPDFKARLSKKEAASWKVLKKTTGDLNNDGIEDLAVIYETIDSVGNFRCTTAYIDTVPARSLVVFLSSGKHLLKIVQNNDFIARANEGGMLTYLEPEIVIEKSQLKISYQYTRSNETYTFSLVNDSLRLIELYRGGISSAGMGSTEFTWVDFDNNSVVIEKGFIDSDTSEIDTFRLNATRLKTLNELRCLGNDLLNFYPSEN